MSRYRKIEVRTWGDERFRKLTPIPECGRGLWFYLLTGPHTGPIPGLSRAGRGGMADDLGWSTRGFDKAFKEVSDLGMAKADFEAKVVWIPKAVKHNRPESPNVIRAWGKEFDLIPECELKWEAFFHLKAFTEGLPEAFGKAFQDAFAKALAEASTKLLAKTKPYQEQEQESYPSQESLKSGSVLPQRLVPAPRGLSSTPASSAAPNGQTDDWDENTPFGKDAA